MILTEVFLFFLSQKHWLVDEKVSDQENIDLVTPFSEEVKLTLFQMEKNKAAGSDELPIEFYQKTEIL
jgi:hypothetical protein